MTGTLVLVVGPSGAGKDTLIGGAREALAGDPAWVFPRRIVTRPAEAGGEPHVHLSLVAFEQAEVAGAFALSWRAHGLAYGIPGTVRSDLEAGRHVVVNVSRGVIDEARRRFPRIAVVLVTVPAAVLAARLAGRGRETAEDMAHRLERAGTAAVEGPGVHEIVNEGPVDEGTARLVALLRRFATE